MTELDEVWAQKLNQAIIEARAKDQKDLAEYLILRETNDSIRTASINWLFDSITEIAAFANRSTPSITIEKESPHQFEFFGANLVGSILRFRLGVRCLNVEAGWTRTPADGFMRGGALAAARIFHFGMKEHTQEILLLPNNNLPNWFSFENGKRLMFDSNGLRRHFEIFTSSN